MTSRLISQSSRHIFKLTNRVFDSARNGVHLASFNQCPLQLKMPALSPTMTEGTIIKWHKKEGDAIQPGDLLLEIQTDKAVIPYELEEEGVIAKIIAEDSKIIQVGGLIGIMALPGEDWKNLKSIEVTEQAAAPASVAQPAVAAVESDHHHHQNSNSYLKIMPAARTLIDGYNINPSLIKGSRGFISKSDVKEYIIKNNLSSAAAAPTQPTEPVKVANVSPIKQAAAAAGPKTHPEHEPDFEDIELSNMRKVIAKRLVLSKTTIPHSYISTNCVVDKIVALRKEMIKNNQKVSLNDFIIKAIALALKLVPEVNSNQIAGSDEFKQLPTVDISVAVATDKGLITPIVANADKLSVLQISERVKLLADKARQGKLLPHEFQGGSFSISNLGMFGITEFSAVINPPQIAILAVGSSQLKFNSELKAQTEVAFTLSYDERCVDLNRAQRFMNTLNYLIAHPDLLVEPTQSF